MRNALLLVCVATATAMGAEWDAAPESDYVGASKGKTIFRLEDGELIRVPTSELSEEDLRQIRRLRRRPKSLTSEQLARYERDRERDREKFERRKEVASFYNARGNYLRTRNAQRNALVLQSRIATANIGMYLLASQIAAQNARRPVGRSSRYGYGYGYGCPGSSSSSSYGY